MDKNGFYIKLPSNSSSHIYPNNKIWNYRTKLAIPIVLKEPHEVGLIEVQFPRVWNTFSRKDAVINIYNTETRDVYNITLSVGFYETVTKIVKEFNARVNENPSTARVSMQYNNITNPKPVYFMGANGLTFIFKGKLAHIWGFKPGVAFIIPVDSEKKKIHIPPYPADIHGGEYNIFIYSDIADYQLVGDSHVPLLRSINICDDERRMP
ncbi:hypothetical protein, partial [Paraclostridium dentum]|uniref:hypothetical protein n=1 Tax=Paraclostridium dentum TaxID=2662455 RepID=UPI003F3B4E51